ncbi:MAG TPA: transcription elongation factor GreB [Dokdonella sp.]|uniref:transcription elongation factor GreB n=1 Tax=Dokdonella sp. TaxID=2291710 RepID=UPI002D8085AF|nr:transcription elongation factor GreB [Dokdonella sp.]HET9031581.1 transcription elongation factor GreB [Dokdonella sp.]
MSRWRPPGEISSTLITVTGLDRLQRELDELWRVRRPEVVSAITAAAAEGDRSENAEYIYRKKQLAEIDRRVRYLSKRIPSLRPATELPTDRSAIYFGAWFSVEDDDGSEHDYRIVGADETDAGLGWISIDAPFARAALKRRVDDEFEVQTPQGLRRCLVTRVCYEQPLVAPTRK